MSRITRITVVGAGAAGLMAALDLEAAGHDVTVLEARNRIGGRIHTVRFDNGLWANAGAEWLNSSDRIALALCDRFGIDLTPKSGFESLVYDGEIESREDDFGPLFDLVDELVASLGDADHPWADPVARTLDRLSVSDWLDGLAGDTTAEARSAFETAIRGEYMVGVDELSMAALVLNRAHMVDDSFARFTEGTTALTDAMANALTTEVRLAEPLSAITHTESSVTLSTTRGTYDCDAVVLALPLPALRSVAVEPTMDFPWIDQGRGGKLLVPYAERAWTTSAPQSAADFPGEFVYDNASHQKSDAGVLAAYSVDVIDDDRVLKAFATWFPTLGAPVADPVQAWWSREPESGTTYSAPKPNYLDSLERLRKPFGRLYLAGEYTEMKFGFIEGALVSGRRVASAINGVLR